MINGASLNPDIITIKKLCDGLDIVLREFFQQKKFNELEQEIR